jgi:xanthine dehydrogenase accessory factor
MREVLDELYQHYQLGRPIALATVVSTFKSAPRPAGTSMLVTDDGHAVGSVSGGCVEGAVYELGTEVLAERKPVLQRYGVSDDTAFSVGLTCGGLIDIFVERVDKENFPELARLYDSVHGKQTVALATIVEHADAAFVGRHLLIWQDKTEGTLGSSRIDDAVADDARGLLAVGTDGPLHYGAHGERRGEGMTVFVDVFQPPARMIVFGAIDFASSLTGLGAYLGYHVTVCDARPIFATASRFPEANEVVVDWPHRYLQVQLEQGLLDERTVVAVLTHDPKFDIPVLEIALRARLAYVGAMGSRRTHADRLERLREVGLTEAELARLRSPIGLDLGARTPQETAISIAAEIIALRWGGEGKPLQATAGPIHRG